MSLGLGLKLSLGSGLVPSAPVPLTPATYLGANCKYWGYAGFGALKASGSAGANGDLIKTLTDGSSYGNDAINADAGEQPTLVTNWQNGLPALRFGAVDLDRLFVTFADMITGPWSVIMVASKDNDPDTVERNDAMCGFTGTGRHKCLLDLIGGLRYVATETTNTTTSTPYGCGTAPAILSWSAADSGTPVVHVNRVNLVTSGARPATSGITGFYLGGGNSIELQGYIGEIVVVDRELTADDYTFFEDTYFGPKWDI
jgi:hypothetical protein